MAFDISTLNGINFGASTFGHAKVTDTSDLNPAGGRTDVSSATTGSMSVAYITKAGNPGTILKAVQYTLGDGNYQSATSTTFGTFGYIVLDSVFDPSPSPAKYFVHGFSENALLLSRGYILTLDQVNGLDAGSDNNYFEILSNSNLTVGSTSPVMSFSPSTYVPGDPESAYVWYSDAAGIRHGFRYFIYNGNIYDERYGFGGNIFPVNSAPGLNPNPPTYPLVFTQDSSVYTPACFATGTRIETARGAARVEDLAPGDEVLTAAGERRPVVWVGRRRIRPARHARPLDVQPIRVRAHAFGHGLPRRDLILSPGHAVYMDGTLIPVGRLINGATVVQETVEEVCYFHVELDAHDVLLAEGLPCESYLDDGNRATFANADEHVDLHGRLDPISWDDACAPVVADGPQLAAARARLVAQAEALGWRRIEAPELTLVAGGRPLAPVRAQGLRAWFMAPAGEALRLASNHAVLGQVVPEFADPRRLGVAVAAVKVDGVPVPLDSPAFGQGFYPLETHQGAAWRWTDGDAELVLDLPNGALIEVAMLMAAPSWRAPDAPLAAAQVN